MEKIEILEQKLKIAKRKGTADCAALGVRFALAVAYASRACLAQCMHAVYFDCVTLY